MGRLKMGRPRRPGVLELAYISVFYPKSILSIFDICATFEKVLIPFCVQHNCYTLEEGMR